MPVQYPELFTGGQLPIDLGNVCGFIGRGEGFKDGASGAIEHARGRTWTSNRFGMRQGSRVRNKFGHLV